MCDLITTKFLGEGQTSRVYAAQTSNKRSIAVKVTVRNIDFNVQPCEIEATILERLSSVVPRGVPRFYGASWCRNFKAGVFKRQRHTPDVTQQFILKMEYFPRGNLKDFITKLHGQKKLTDDILRDCIAQVLTALREIKKKIPSFRHNDLHLANILIADWQPGTTNFYNTYALTSRGFRCVIYDFNLSSMSGVHNPLLSVPTYRSEYGIYEGNSDKYDVHFFLNSILDWINKNGAGGKYSQTRDFLNRCLPVGYQGNRGAKVNLFRLRPDVSTSSLVSLDAVFKDSYFRPMQNTFNELEEGEYVPEVTPSLNPYKVKQAPNLKTLVVPSVKKNATARVKTTAQERLSWLVGHRRRLAQNFYNTNAFKVMQNLVTSPETNGETTSNRNARIQRGFRRAEDEFLTKRAPVPVQPRPNVKFTPRVIVPRAETKVLEVKQAPKPLEIKAPAFKAPKPIAKSTLYKKLNNLLKNNTRPKFSYAMSTRDFKSGGILPTIKLDKSYLKCENLDRELLDLIAQEHGLDPKQFKSKTTLCGALKVLHNS